MAGAAIKVEVELGGSLVDLTSLLMWCDVERGRQTAHSGDEPGRGQFRFDDPARAFDPLNVGSRTVGGVSFDEGDLVGGARVLVSLTPAGGSAHVRWAGEVVEWAPSTVDGNDASPFVDVECIGLVGSLYPPQPLYVNDRLLDRLGRARARCAYTFNSANGGVTGRVEDFSGANADGLAYTGETAGTKGYVSVSPGTISMLSDSSVVVPLPADTMRTSPEGLLVVLRFELGIQSGPAGSFEENVLWSEGADELGDDLGSMRDGALLMLVETRAGGATADSNVMTLNFQAWEDGTKVHDQDLAVGDRGEWVGHDRVVVLALDQQKSTLAAAAVDGDGTVDGIAAVVGTVDYWRQGSDGNTPAPQFLTTNRLMRFGRSFNWTVSGPDALTGKLDLCAAGYVASSSDVAASITFAATQYAGLAFLAPLATDRLEQYRAGIAWPAADWDVSGFTEALSMNEFRLVGETSTLERVREVVLMGQGRLCQAVGGDVRIEDFDHVQTRCAAPAASTWSDQGGGALAYRAGSARITTGRASVVNRFTIATPQGFTYTAEDSASVAKHGVRSAQAELPFADEDQATAYADAVVARFKTQRAHISSVIVQPKGTAAETAAWWAELAVRDLGDRVDVVRQPGKVGTVANVPSVIEGERWTWSAPDDAFEFEFYLSPAAFYDGISYP